MATNLTPGFDGSGLNGWATSGGTLTSQSGAGQDGAGFARFTSQSAGNRNITSALIPCSPGQAMSGEMYAKLTSATARQVQLMWLFKDNANVQIGTVASGAAINLTTVAGYLLAEAVNKVAPAGTVNAQLQLRVLSSVSGDVVEIDNIFSNYGTSVDRSTPPPTGLPFTYWDGSQELLVSSASYWDGTVETAVDLSSVQL